MTQPDLNDLERELVNNPRAFALRVVGLMGTLDALQRDVRRGVWVAMTVLVGVIVDLALRLSDKPDAVSVAKAALSLVT